MHISVYFHFNDQDSPAAVTGVSGSVTDLILPCVGDMVRLVDDHDAVFLGKVTERLYSYEITNGLDVNGTVTVTLSMDHVPIQ